MLLGGGVVASVLGGTVLALLVLVALSVLPGEGPPGCARPRRAIMAATGSTTTTGDRTMATTATTAPSTFEGFGPDLVELYEGLAADNSKAYWEAHRSVYDEQVGGPAKALAAALEAEFGPVKVFRPHRDVRFSKDRTPYKTNVSIAGGRDGAGTYYFSVSPDGVDLAGGLYQPSKDQLHRFRQLQDDERRTGEMDALLTALDGEGFSMMEEGALKTAPRGWSKDHPRVDVLRLKHLAVGQDRQPGPWLESAACLEQVAAAWRVVGRWNAWLESRVGVPLEATGPSGTSAPR